MCLSKARVLLLEFDHGSLKPYGLARYPFAGKASSSETEERKGKERKGEERIRGQRHKGFITV